MTRQRLESYMDDPGRLDEQSLPEIIELAKEFPYFQAAWMLIAKNLKNIEHLKYPHILHTAAAYAGDRKKLKQLLEIPVYNAPLPLAEPQKPQIAEEKLLTPAEAIAQKSTRPETPLETESVNLPTGGINEIPATNVKEETIENTPVEVNPLHESAKSTEVNKKLKNDLIEKFIREEPTLSQPKREFFSPVDMAKQSMSEREDIVSETLADIYIKQGLIDKAIKIFEKLIVIIPEKSSYFANRIKELK